MGHDRRTLFLRFATPLLESEAGHLGEYRAGRPHPGTQDSTNYGGSLKHSSGVKTRISKRQARILHKASHGSKFEQLKHLESKVCSHTYAK